MSAGAPVGFLGLRFQAATLDEALDEVFARADGHAFTYLVTPNVAHVVMLDRAGREPEAAAFAAAYADAAATLCDSRVLARLARLSGLSLAVVPGSDLTRALLADPRLGGRTVAAVGGSAALVPALIASVPGVRFVQHRPPMGALRDPAALDAIEGFVAATRADIVIFAIGAPQSEIAAHRCLGAGRSRGVALCTGASLEFVTGEKRRAPRWMQRAGVEWAFRLASEPRRLWRRYLIEGPRVFAIWARHRRR